MNDDTYHKEHPFESLIGNIITAIFWFYFLLFLGWAIIGTCRLLWKGTVYLWRYVFVPIMQISIRGIISSYTFIINSERKLLRENRLNF